MWDRKTGLEEMFRALADAIGLKRFNFQIHLNPTRMDYCMSGSTILDGIATMLEPKDVMDRFFKPILEDVRNSDVVRQELAELKARAEAAEKEVERMKPFETYYNMAFEMNNGKKP